MSLNEHTQFFGAPGEPTPPKMPLSSTPSLSSNIGIPVEPSVEPDPMPESPSAPPRDNKKLIGALAIGAVAVGSVGFISWTAFDGEEEVAPPVAAPDSVIQKVVPELVIEPEPEMKAPEPVVEEVKPSPPPAPKPVVARAPKPKPEPEPMASPVLPDDIKIANVSDDTEFKDAFLEARDQVGPGGLFEYKGHWYSTFSIEEWNKMPADMRDEFNTRIEPIVNPIETAEAEPVTEAPLEPLVLKLDTDNDGVDDVFMSDKNRDGKADLLIKDEAGEGTSGIMYVDKDNDGKLETAIPVSDEGKVLEDQSYKLDTPLEMPMGGENTATASLGGGEISEVIEVESESIEMAVPVHQDLAHFDPIQHTELPITLDPNFGTDAEIDAATDDLFNV